MSRNKWQSFSNLIDYHKEPIPFEYNKEDSHFGNTEVYFNNSDNVMFRYWYIKDQWVAFRHNFEIGALTNDGIKLAEDFLHNERGLNIEIYRTVYERQYKVK